MPGLLLLRAACLDGEAVRAGPNVFNQLAGLAPEALPQAARASAIAEPVVLAGLVAEEPAWQAWEQVLTGGLSPSVVRAEVAAAGLRGRGGAGFPVAAKWSAALAEPVPRYVVGNGDEGDRARTATGC